MEIDERDGHLSKAEPSTSESFEPGANVIVERDWH
jgi:hypothetical protein